MPQVPALQDVAAQFRSLNRHGERLGVGEGFPQDFSDKRYTTLHSDGGRNNHFQGVQRLGQHLLVTGSFPYSKKRADLLVFRMASRSAKPGPWGSNMIREPAPPPVDRLVNYFRLDTTFWHPGGFGLLEDVAVIPLENSAGESKIVFVDLSVVESPRILDDLTIPRPLWKAGACTITRAPSGQLLVAVWSDSDVAPPAGPAPPFHLDLYASRTTSAVAGFDLVGHFFPPPSSAFHNKWQTMDFLWEGLPDPTRLFLVAFENTHPTQPHPTQPGSNRGCLFEFDLKAVPVAPLTGGPVTLPATLLRLVDTVSFETSGHWCNMDAGAGAYVDEDQQLLVYAVYHFLEKIGGTASFPDPVLRCLEYRATAFGAIDRIEDAWIDLYEEAGLQGRQLGLSGLATSTIEDAKRALGDGAPFTVARSVRYQLPPDMALVLFPDPHFQGGPALVLPGDGMVRECNLMTTPFTGSFRSCQPQPLHAALGLPGRIVPD